MEFHIIIQFTFESIHCWPECNIPEVEYLKFPHRHVFHVKAAKKVSHTNRETEIIMFKKRLKKYCEMHVKSGHFETDSCEQIALKLMKNFYLSECEVLEDGENGAKVIR